MTRAIFRKLLSIHFGRKIAKQLVKNGLRVSRPKPFTIGVLLFIESCIFKRLPVFEDVETYLLGKNKYAWARALLFYDDEAAVKLLRTYRTEDLLQAVKYRPWLKIRLVRKLRVMGDIRTSMLIMSEPIMKLIFRPFHNMVRGQFVLLTEKDIVDSTVVVKNSSRENSVDYLLHNSLPYNSGGYATRSHGVVEGLRRKGIELRPCSRLGYPYDRGIALLANDDADNIDGIYYQRLLSSKKGLGKIPIDQYLCSYLDSYLNREGFPKVIHGVSNYMNGAIAAKAAKILGIKSVYEVRGLWEVTRISREPDWFHSDAYKLAVKMETQTALDADRVITITEALKSELVRRGVPQQKIAVIPNGVDTEKFKPMITNYELKSELFGEAAEDKKIVSFIGSFASYEGIELLVHVFDKLRRKRGDVLLMLVGDGAVYENIKSLVHELELDDLVKITGRVQHELVPEYYSITDLAVFPRYSLPVTEMVSPIKPFEAMAMSVPVLVSDVEAMQEFIESGVNGFTFKKDSLDDLLHNIEAILNKPELASKLKIESRKWVVENRDWSKITDLFVDIYRDLGVDCPS